MELEQAREYRDNLKQEIHGAPISLAKWWILEQRNADPCYSESRQIILDDRRQRISERHAKLEPESLEARLEEATATTFPETNPLLEVQEVEQLTHEQQTVLWANQVMGEYSALPQGNRAERKRAQRFAENIAEELIKEPARINTSAEIWKAHEIQPVVHGVRPLVGLYENVKTELTRALKRKEALSQEKLKQLLKAYAYGAEVKDMSQAALAAYLNRDLPLEERLDMLMSIPDAALDFLDDQTTLEKTLLIANWQDEAVLRKGSGVFIDYVVARSMVDNDALMAKAWVFDTVSFDLLRLTSISRSEVKKNNSSTAYNNSSVMHAIEQLGVREIKSIKQKSGISTEQALAEYERRMRLLGATDIEYAVTEEEHSRFIEKWPISAISGEKMPPLKRKFNLIAAPLVNSLQAQGQFREALRQSQIFETTSINIPIPAQVGLSRSVMMDMCIGGPLDENQRLTIIRDAMLDIARKKPEYERMVVQLFDRFDLMAAEVVSPLRRLNDLIYLYWLRRPSVPEDKIHHIAALEAIGLPQPKLKSSETLSEVAEIQHRKVLGEYVRFINDRGVRISFRSKKFRGLGYEGVVFKKDNDGILAEIQTNNLAYRLRLDSRFIIDSEGKTLPSPTFNQSLHYLLMSLLEPVICEVKEKGDAGEETGENREVTTRVGHFRELVGGQHYSGAAILRCLEETGKDLVAEQARIQNRPGRETLNPFTYVRAVREDIANLPPMEFTVSHLPRLD